MARKNGALKNKVARSPWLLRGMLMLPFTQIASQDQFGKAVEWKNFAGVPWVLVLGGEKAAKDSQKWGILLKDTFNPNYKPVPEHLQKLSPSEKVKVIAVATLPNVPSLFQGFFRNGFRKEVQDFGMLLDFHGEVSAHFGVKTDQILPTLAIISSDQKKPTIFQASFENTALKNSILEEIRKKLTSREKR